MSQIHPANTAVLTSAERWLCWEQRGRDNDARLPGRARILLLAAVSIVTSAMVFLRLLG